MARKGSRKVRTGCLTCKTRRVKCDEGKPHCNRCTHTGRTCDGYATKPIGLLWHRPRQLFQSVDSASEARALQFFCERTAQFLSGATDPYFWTHLVMQFSNFEPAVRHSVVAISSLYEQYQALDAAAHSGVQLKDNSLALQHYNAAIRELKTTDNQPLVLLVCILFICIEFLQSDKDAAIQHLKHGAALLGHVNYSWAREHLLPVFRRLSVFPYFFGKGRDEFPDLLPPDDPLPVFFTSYADAQSAMDILLSRILRLVRWGDVYRFGGMRYKDVPLELLVERDEIVYLLKEWQALFKDLDARSSSSAISTTERHRMKIDPARVASRTALSTRYEVCQILLAVAFETDEMHYDLHLSGFQRALNSFLILESANINGPQAPATKHKPQFSFETGLMPWLQIIATKCRGLNIRLEVLRLLKVLAVPRENLWEVDQMYALARRVIEIEHGVLLNDSGRPVTQALYPGFPPDERRVRFTKVEPRASVHTDIDGKEAYGWAVGFVMCDQHDRILVHNEFIPT